MHVIPRLLVLAAVLVAVCASVLDSRLQLLLAAHKVQSAGDGGTKASPDHASDIHVIAGSAHNAHTVQGLLAAMAALEFGNTRSAGNAGNAGIEDPLEAQAKAEDLFWADEGVEQSDADSKATLDAVRGHAVFVDEGGAVGAKVMGVRDSADDSLLHDLRARGFVIPEYYNNRKVFTARAPLAALASIDSLKSASALRLSLGTPLTPVLDTSVPELYGFPHRTMKNYPLDGSKTGAGVIFGVVDTGVDIGHPNFNNHVTRYWHQPANALGDAIEICTFYCCGCTESHGTHVTATAAGQYGVAPAAEIRAVESTMVNTDILDGVNWLITEAQQDNKSIVINLSLGTVVGVMDGQDTLDVGISEAVRGGSSSLLPGVVVVVAAGNEADANHMFTHTFTRENEDIVITAVVEPYQPTFDSSMFIVHFIGPLNDAFALQLGTPLGITFDFGTIPNQQVGCALADFSLGSAILCPEGAVRDNLQLFWMAITTNVTDVDFGILVGSWQFNITPSAFDNTVDNHLFTARIVSTTSNLNVQLANATKEMTLTSPGTSEDVITVAAYDTKWKWKALLHNRTLDTNRDGDLSYCELGWDLTDNKTGCSPERDIYGELCSFSSRGPTRDNRTKPEVAAPGGGIAAAVSRFQFTLGNVYSANQTTADWERGVYQIMQGTSMACPHVAGAIAVLLQRNSSLTVDDARTLLEKSAIPPTTSAVDENGPYAWGAGKVNATAAIARQTRKPAHTPKPKPSKKPKLEPLLEDMHRPSTWSSKLDALWKWV